jgi:signal transduction histidine kinase
LAVSGIAAGAAAALVAIVVARRALKPLRDAASVVGTIDERRLDRRVDVAPLPPELQPTAATLNQMLATLEEAFERRRRFLADASHELRTPVAALAMTLEVALRRPRSEAELRQTAEHCLRDVNMLRELVERLLDQVRSEQYGDAGAAATITPADAVAKAIGVVAPLADRKGVRLHDTASVAGPLTTQPHRLHSILVNLISNAVEHHDRQGGNVWVMAEAAGDQAIFTVRDDGPGIPAEQQPHVFEPFYRGNASREAAGGHLGLGLFLVQSHTKALGGRCEMDSRLGEGTTFRVTVPGYTPAVNASPPEPQWAGAGGT